MAKVELLRDRILKWEGGFCNDPLDAGGATNKGVTIATFRQVFGQDKTVEELKKLTNDQFMTVLKRFYWDRWKADEIKNQSIANILVDWVWGSGKWGIVIPQRILHLTADGVVGNITISAVNSADQKKLFDEIWQARKEFLDGIVKRNPSQVRFIKGWMNRLNDYKYSDK